MHITRHLLLPGCFFLLFGCQSGEPDQAEAATEEPPAAAAQKTYPSIPDSTMQHLWERCDFVDYIFYELDFSVSQSSQSEIRKSLQHVSRVVPEIVPACRPIGHLFYQVEGENVLEADIFYSPECQYYLFYRDGEPAYANAMTPAGMQFYEYLLTQVGR